MGNINYDHIEAYLQELTPPRDSFLERLEDYAQQFGVPIVGPEMGAFLCILAASIRAERVLELGTAIGYSTTWLARGVAPHGGKVLSVEGWEQMADKAAANLRLAGLDDVVTIEQGMAEEVVGRLEGPFDLIFNDVDKTRYPRLLPRLVDLLRVGGLLVTDNVLWSGKVATSDDSPSTAAIRRYNEMLFSDPRLMTVIAPIRDGAGISRKIEEGEAPADW